MSRVSHLCFSMIIDIFLIEDAPYNINITADSETFVKGRRLHLKCSAKANPPPQYLWQKNGAQLPRQSSQLFFLSLNYSDNGTYTCTVSNSLGSSASSKFLLIVDGMLFLLIVMLTRLFRTSGRVYHFVR